jgi:alkanesulfonate monooxygenase SsuD/methylene tetrahydromethanopterin reductase-like flavin-dependent oxidoreductase (luciferase family)
MPDYGHDLLFGTFITPSNQHADAVVGLAELTDRVGLDLVTFQDHPYQPAFLDTWTLLSYVAARTSTVRLSANVLNLPLRQPAVLARSAASLDILSGGRVELGLGAGGFWDAIEAMGGPRRTPGEAVVALDEAIQVIRQIWDADNRGADNRGGVRVDGVHYPVHGATRGPRPAHDIGVWIGAHKPRMLRLTGRVADGWLPSLPYLQAGQLAEGNAIIDQAAAEAGRSPADVRRLLNVAGELSVDELVDLALTDGISAFIMMGDDPNQIQRFAEEVAPAVRELVASERTASAGVPTSGRAAPLSGPATVRSAGPAAESDSDLGVTPTRDDGERLGTTMPWDESTRPTSPESPAGTTYTAQGKTNAQHLIDVHDHLRAELRSVRDLIDQVRGGSIDPGTARSAINEMTLRQNNWSLGAYCASYCRLVTQHHTLEDQAMFPYLRARDADLAPVIDRLADEHKVIHTVIEDLDRALVTHLNGSADLGELQDALDALTDALLSHLAYEERELVEPIARHITSAV